MPLCGAGANRRKSSRCQRRFRSSWRHMQRASSCSRRRGSCCGAPTSALSRSPSLSATKFWTSPCHLSRPPSSCTSGCGPCLPLCTGKSTSRCLGIRRHSTNFAAYSHYSTPTPLLDTKEIECLSISFTELEAVVPVQTRAEWPAAQLAHAVGLSLEALRQRIMFWINQGVLAESRTAAGVVRVPSLLDP